VTSVVTAPGTTYTDIHTSTSVYVTNLETIIYQTWVPPPVTKSEQHYEEATYTKIHPVTETKAIEGNTVVLTWTSTAAYKTFIPPTQSEHVSYTKPEYVGSPVQGASTEARIPEATKELTLTVSGSPSRSVLEYAAVTQHSTHPGAYASNAPLSAPQYATSSPYPTTVRTSVGTTYTPPRPSSTSFVQVPIGLAPRATPAAAAIFLGAAGILAII
jgi:hypothetical protein